MSETEYRIEHDSMGEVRVPVDALWRAQTQRAVENFPISGRPLEPALIHALAHIKGAAMLSGDFDPQFELAGLRKDLALIAADARTAGVPTDLVDVLAQAYKTAAGATATPRDIAAVVDAFRPGRAEWPEEPTPAS